MYYISRNYKSLFNAAGKAKTDCEFVFQKMGFKNLGFKQSSIPNSAIGTIKNFFGIFLALLKLPRKSTIVTQYPNNKFRGMIMFFSKAKKCKIITIVHDVRILKGRTKDVAAELNQIITSDVIIVHNPSMKQWFLEQGVSIPIIVLGIFDYISEQRPKQNTNRKLNDTYSIAYAGGFGDGKNSYIFDFDMLENRNYDLRLYGIGFDPKKRKVEEAKSVVYYEGVFKSDEVAYKIESDFGLVWDGISTETCSGNYGEYLQFNNPHKTSLYLLCGLPVIIWDKAALADFVRENNIGVTVSNLKDLNKILGDLSTEDYHKMKRNVTEIQTKVMEGYFVETAVNKALTYIQ
ncbi:beta-1,6-galactofuranosyltransferase [Hyunsoonleella pacifica]|uniref:Beta-1,6-galactofuranosyltransferase n=1 Tax=Hyunsoonleella pacifica TaxID=1080224 RepID=A0A4Q9FQ32_9FLAO|nr:beta-1,6-galactofuranosyltransferase [Hyunsoonleella pacifica]TBN17541.1 beta-1,6-galactofuranosyltransferase [Hyunsoonleella pacifica]GGD11038.1 beta-1,6-galactofuranosyltransferase [Hyunsoonleella pacifica]